MQTQNYGSFVPPVNLTLRSFLHLFNVTQYEVYSGELPAGYYIFYFNNALEKSCNLPTLTQTRLELFLLFETKVIFLNKFLLIPNIVLLLITCNFFIIFL